MALNSNTFIEGINPTATFGGYASVLLQLIRQAIPSSTYGMILFDTTPPDVTGSNAWRKTCIWLNLSNPSLPTVNVYKEGGSPGWVNVNNIIGNDAIVTAMISNNAVTLAKLSTTGGSANQLIRVNAGGSAFEFVSLNNLVTAGSINVSALNTVGIPATQFRIPGTTGPGTAAWVLPSSVIDNLPDGYIANDYIAPAANATSRSQFLTTRLGDPFAAWRYFDPTNDLQPNAMNGDRVTNSSIALSKIIPATSDALLVTQGGAVSWIPYPTANFVNKYVSAEIAIPPHTSPIMTPLNHGLGGQPIMLYAVLRCVDAGGDAGYNQGEEVPIETFYVQDGNSDEPAFAPRATATQILCRRTSESTIETMNVSSGITPHTIVENHWRLKFYALI
jgi:hypothetical protein